MNQQPDQSAYPINIPQQKPPIKLSRVRLHVGIGAFAVALVFLLSSLAQIIIHSIVLNVAPEVAENDWYMWVMSGVPMYAFAMPLSYLLLRTVPADRPKKQKLHPLMWAGFLCLCFALSFIANYLGQYVSAWFSNLTGIQIENELEQMTVNTPFFINLLFVGILAPVFEELFFRKAVIDRLRRYGDLPAILISGLAFGLIHGNLSQVFYATAVGMLLSFLYVRTGSVLYTISIHAAFNMIGGVYTTEILRRTGESLTPAEGDVLGWVMLASYSLFTVVALVIGVVFLLVNVRSFARSLKKGDYTLTFDQWMNVITLNPGVWMFVLMILLLFLSSFLS